MVLMMGTSMQSAQRQQNEANISYVLPWSNMQDMEGEPILSQIYVGTVPSNILQKQTVLWDSGHYLYRGWSWVLKK